MLFYTFYFTLYFFCFTWCGSKLHPVSDKMRKKLESEEHNAMCCRNKLDCCKQEPENAPKFEVKTLITDCPHPQCNYSNQHPIVINRNNKTSDKLTNCNQKLLLTIKMTNEGVPCDKSEYVIVDHVIDKLTQKKVRILNPYAVRIRQDPMMQVYDLVFERSVNGEAKEKVMNRHNRNYRGCNTGPDNPTCGIVEHEGRIIPYSTGFCCSCDSEKNRRMQEENEDGVQWPADSKKRPLADNYYIPASGSKPKLYDDDSMAKRADKRVNYRQSIDNKPVLRQRRGGQSCDDADLDNLPESFRESTHCLEFSHLWYNVYQIKKPRVLHKLRVQIFQKYEDCHGNTHWMDVTRGRVLQMGTQACTFNDPDSGVVAHYSAEDIEECHQALNYKTQKLLVPERKVADPAMFMIVPRHLIAAHGKSCNTAGVGYEAFNKQKDRCSKPKGTCLANQPQHFYNRDMTAMRAKRQGKYFLKFFGALSSDPIGYNATGQIQNLKLMYTKKHVSTVYFEVKADLVSLLEPNVLATITEVYTDATNPKKTRIIVKVTNSGLLYGVYYVRLSGCPMDVPATFNNIASKSVLIAAQQQHIFNLYIEYSLPISEFECSIHVHNINQELLAIRRIRIQSYDRCICIWYCRCACLEKDGGLKCKPLTLQSYHDAGFQGGLPMETHMIEPSFLDDILALLFHMFIILILTLLIMGLIKALLGLCIREISLWGLDTILGTEHSDVICENKQCELRQDGVSLSAQFCLNLIFFFIYPLALINVAIKKLCFSSYTNESECCSCEGHLVMEDEDDVREPRLRRRVSSKTTGSVGKSTTDASSISMKYTTSEEKNA